MTVFFKKLRDGAQIPTYAHDYDAGADLYAAEPALIQPGHWELVKTGIALEIPPSWVGLIHPRSGLALSQGVTVLNAPGTIDAGYRGEIGVVLINHSSEWVRINEGDRIAQIIFQEAYHPYFAERELTEASRGSNGFGSSGA